MKKEDKGSVTLQRFHEAQKDVYDLALSELQRGHKESHWMWYIFPQIKGLGMSPYSQYYGIAGKTEAKAYLADPVLKERLIRLCEVLLSLETDDAHTIFSNIDTIKLCSCMTLFDAVSDEKIFQQVLDRFFEGQKDEKTLALLKEAFYKVFTYGTLMQDQRNHFYVEDSTYLGDAVLDGYGLYDTGYGYPAAVRMQDHKVYGEVYEVDEATKEAMDVLEDVGHLYDCKTVSVTMNGHKEEVLFYEYLQDTVEMEVCELSGKWQG